MLTELDKPVEGLCITSVQWFVLTHIANGIGCAGSELCLSLNCHTGSMNRVLECLEEKGLVLRRWSMVGRRVVELALRELGAALRPQVRDASPRMLADFPGEEPELFEFLVRHLRGNLGVESLLS